MADNEKKDAGKSWLACLSKEAKAVFAAVEEDFGVLPDYPFSDDVYKSTAVFRRPDNRKWFAVFMPGVEKRKLGADDGEDGSVDIVTFKCDPFLSGSLRLTAGFFPGYHMNKEHWVSALLDGSADTETLRGLLSAAYESVAPKIPRRKKAGDDDKSATDASRPSNK